MKIFRVDDSPLARVWERQVGFERVMQLLGLLCFTLEIDPRVKRSFARQVLQVPILFQYLNNIREAHLTLFLREDLLQNLIHGVRS